MKKKNGPKAFVAMSGGVDSSVAAALLNRAGVDTVGVFMKLADTSRFKEGEKNTRKVAEILKIPFLVLDLRKEFREKIIGPFLEGYKRGITPNPCVECNYQIKFKLLFDKVKISGNKFFATGHYARIKQENPNTNPPAGGKIPKYKLLKGKDKKKDQSYFLWQLRQKQLKKILFPVGNYTKKEVKNLAREFKLPVLDRKESQEICFIPEEINDFLRKHLKTKPGPIAEKFSSGEEKIIGRHHGLWFYTVGQRKGIGLPAGPHYVLDKDIKRNRLIVTKSEKDLYKKDLIAEKVNWISPEQSLRDATGKVSKEPKFPLKVKAKIRYRHKPAPAIIYPDIPHTTYKIRFNKAQRAITPGQSVVFFNKEELLGGGIIC